MKKVLLGDITTFLARGIAPKYTDDESFYVLNQKCIRDWRVSLGDVRFTDNISKKVHSDRILQDGDILVNSTGKGTLGRVAQFSKLDKKATVDSHITIVRPNQDIVDAGYLGYVLKSRQNQIEMMAEGSTGQTELSKVKLSNMTIDLPDVNKQKNIADILGGLDEKIELNRRMNETLEQIGQTLFRHYFIDNPERKKWDTVPLSELCDNIASGGTPSTRIECYYDGSIQWYSTKELKDSFMLNSEKTITHNGLENSSAKIFPADTVVMAIYAAPTVGRLGILTKEAAFNQAACGLVAKAEIGYEFIYLYLFLSRNDLNNLANGAAQQNISVGKVRSFGVIKPDSQTLSEFKTKIETVFQKIKNNYQEIETLVKIRDSLLPKLISGDIEI